MDIKILFITIGIVYTSLINLNKVLLADIKYMFYSYEGRLNTNKPYYKAILSLMKLGSVL